MTRTNGRAAEVLATLANEVASKLDKVSKQEAPTRIAKLQKEQEVYEWAIGLTANEIHLRLVDKLDWLSTQITNKVDGYSLAVDYTEVDALQRALGITETVAV